MKVRAVLVGWVVYLATSFLFTAVIIAILTKPGDTPPEVVARVTASSELQVAMLLVGLAFSAVGGYVAAARAKTRHVAHGAAVGLLSLGLSSVALMSIGAASLTLVDIAEFVLIVPFAAFGGWFKRYSQAVDASAAAKT